MSDFIKNNVVMQNSNKTKRKMMYFSFKHEDGERDSIFLDNIDKIFLDDYYIDALSSNDRIKASYHLCNDDTNNSISYIRCECKYAKPGSPLAETITSSAYAIDTQELIDNFADSVYHNTNINILLKHYKDLALNDLLAKMSEQNIIILNQEYTNIALIKNKKNIIGIANKFKFYKDENEKNNSVFYVELDEIVSRALINNINNERAVKVLTLKIKLENVMYVLNPILASNFKDGLLKTCTFSFSINSIEINKDTEIIKEEKEIKHVSIENVLDKEDYIYDMLEPYLSDEKTTQIKTPSVSNNAIKNLFDFDL